jgi:hypothetical protein
MHKLSERFPAVSQTTSACDVVGDGGFGEQAVAADAVEAARQDVDGGRLATTDGVTEWAGREREDVIGITPIS